MTDTIHRILMRVLLVGLVALAGLIAYAYIMTAMAHACVQRDPSGLFCDDPQVAPAPADRTRRPEVRAWVVRRPESPRVTVTPSSPGDVLENRRECRQMVEVPGDEARTEEAAKLQAKQHWLKTVRFRYGERFLDLASAQGEHMQCSRSDFPVTGGKIGAAVDAITHQWRCQMFAVPCSAPIKREDK